MSPQRVCLHIHIRIWNPRWLGREMPCRVNPVTYGDISILRYIRNSENSVHGWRRFSVRTFLEVWGNDRYPPHRLIRCLSRDMGWSILYMTCDTYVYEDITMSAPKSWCPGSIYRGVLSAWCFGTWVIRMAPFFSDFHLEIPVVFFAKMSTGFFLKRR